VASDHTPGKKRESSAPRQGGLKTALYVRRGPLGESSDRCPGAYLPEATCLYIEVAAPQADTAPGRRSRFERSIPDLPERASPLGHARAV